LHGRGALMGLHDRRDDAEAQPGSGGPGRVVVATHRRPAIEALEHVRGLLRIDSGAGVGDREDGLTGAGIDLDMHGCSWRGVELRVVEQVRCHLTQSPLVSEDHHRAVFVDRDRPVGIASPGILRRLPSDPRQVNGLTLERLLLVQAGEQEHVVDQRAHAGRL
jgi:hypothetical protein